MTVNYEIHIDESGLFGDWEPKQEYQIKDRRVIGGIVVPEELAAREKELHAQLTDIKNRFFPAARNITGIHVSELKDSRKQNELRQALKNIFLNAMPGARVIFIYDRSPEDQINTLPGARFYRKMLYHLLQTVLFYHPQFEADAAFSLKLAHRCFSYASKFEDFLAGKGYLKLRSATDGHTELTAVTSAELESSLDSIKNTLLFPNERTVACTVKTYEKWDNPFMVMADWICNTLLWLLGSCPTDADLLKAAKKTFGEERILFFCPSDFELPGKLVTAFHQEEHDQFLAWYMLREKQTYIPDSLLLYPAYLKVMDNFASRPESLTDEQCSTLTGIADHFLQKRIYSRLTTDVRQLIDLQAGRMAEIFAAPPDDRRDRLAWRYHDAGLRHANHSGNIVAGLDHYEKGKSLFERLPVKSPDDIRDYHLFLNRAAVTSANEFAFTRANAFLQDAYLKEKALTELLGGVRNETYGKICGTMAQNYAFQGDKPNAEKFFRTAREHLLTEKDLPMQASYRAHFAIDNNDSSAFRNEVATVLGLDSFPGYMSCVKKCFEKANPDVFTLHLLLKGLVTFPDDNSSTEKQNLWNLFYSFISSMKQFNHHPWQLLFTIVGRLLAQMNEMSKAQVMWKLAADIFSQDEQDITLVVLVQQARVWDALSRLNMNDTQNAQRLLQPVARLFATRFADGSFRGIWNPMRAVDSDGVVRPGRFDGIGEGFLKLLDETAAPPTADELRALCDAFLRRFTFNYW